MEIPTSFLDKTNYRLQGIVHLPEKVAPSRRVGVIISNSGFGPRNNAHNINVKIARELCSLGYHVLRYDFHGVGESEGEFSSSPYLEWYNKIQNGLFVDDVGIAARYFVEAYKLECAILLGHCGGALSSLFVLPECGLKISGGVFIGLPVTIDQPDRRYEAEMTSGHAREAARGYATKLMNPVSWITFLSFKSDYRDLLRIYWTLVKNKFPRFSNSTDRDDWEKLITHPAFNYKILPAFVSCLKRKIRLKLFYAEFDRAWYEFRDELGEKCLIPDPEFNKYCEIEVIRGANHEYHFIDSQNLLVQRINDWMIQNFPVR